jgi:hypothetical protein
MALRGIEPDAEDMRLAPAGLRQRVEGLFLGQVPQKAHDQLGCDPELPLRAVEGIRQSGHHRVEGNAAPGMPLGIEEHLDMPHILGRHPGEVGEGEIEEILPGPQHRHAGVIEIEKVLERVEPIGRPDRVDVGIRQRHAVARGEVHHHLGLERPLDVKMQLRLGHGRDELMKPRLVHGVPCLLGRRHPRQHATGRRRSEFGYVRAGHRA